MPKLNQIIAVANGKKSRVQAALTQFYHKVQKGEPFSGIARTYRPKDDEGEQLPDESHRVQWRVKEMLQEVREVLTDLFDLVATLDCTNCVAGADVTVDGRVLLSAIPVTHLLFLEKQLVDLHTLVSKLPTLALAEVWHYRDVPDCYATMPSESTRTKKTPRNHVKAEATKEHPAQVEMYFEDVLVGHWETTRFSGAIPEAEKNAMLERVRLLQDAVKKAREAANSVEVSERATGKAVLDYVFGTKLLGAQAQA